MREQIINLTKAMIAAKHYAVATAVLESLGGCATDEALQELWNDLKGVAVAYEVAQ